MIPEYTIVVGVDRRHLSQLAMVWPTWRRNKPSLLKSPMVVFTDSAQGIMFREVKDACDHPDLRTVAWPFCPTTFGGDGSSKFENPQRHKMVAGFVHVASEMVHTAYWLKLDTDAIAMGMDDWIDPGWFVDNPAIVAPPWSFTRPPDQMMRLDQWAEKSKIRFPGPPLNLVPAPGATRVRHPRVEGWCDFFETDFTVAAQSMAATSMRSFQLPVPSLDGYLWYCAERMGRVIVRTRMKERGWECWTTDGNIRAACGRAMA